MWCTAHQIRERCVSSPSLGPRFAPSGRHRTTISRIPHLLPSSTGPVPPCCGACWCPAGGRGHHHGHHWHQPRGQDTIHYAAPTRHRNHSSSSSVAFPPRQTQPQVDNVTPTHYCSRSSNNNVTWPSRQQQHGAVAGSTDTSTKSTTTRTPPLARPMTGTHRLGSSNARLSSTLGPPIPAKPTRPWNACRRRAVASIAGPCGFLRRRSGTR